MTMLTAAPSQTLTDQLPETSAAWRMVAPEMVQLKRTLKATWTAGDYGAISPVLEPGAETFLARNPIAHGQRVLDVACGDGLLTLPLARAGALTVGVDIAPNLLAQGRAKASAQALPVLFDEGDAEEMRYADASFDVLTSFVGAMFAPRPWRVTGEMLRVLRPGGRILMANWTPEGFIGRMFATVAKHVPPSDLMPSPLMWGREEIVRQRFGDAIASWRLTRYEIPLIYPFGPERVVAHFREHFGPMVRAFAALDAAGQDALEKELIALWRQHNQATDGTTCVDSELLEVVAVKA
jgi:SAM-dependent methyltransferase